MKLTENIFTLDINVDFMGHTSTITPVLVNSKDKKILIDTGFPNTYSSFVEALEKVNVKISDLDLIILTHQDIDHVGNAREILENNKNIQILTSETEIPYIDGTKLPHKLNALEENKDNLTPDMEARYNMFKKGFSNTAVTINKGLKDGDILPFVDGIEVIETPGHTIGHMCLYFKKDKILIAGDMLFLENGELKRGRQGINFNDALYEESLRKLSNFDIDAIVLYHGGVLKGDITSQIKALL